MTKYSINLNNITKLFGRRLIFSSLNYNFDSNTVYGIVGNNGTGKSTLSKIICGIITPTQGKVIHLESGKEIPAEKLHNKIGFVSPYLFLYDEFTAEENLFHFSKIRGLRYDKERADFLFNKFNLDTRKNDLLRGYSSGMKQRMKFIFALYHNPPLLIFDEPTSNLDTQGKDTVYNVIAEEKKDKCIIIASNENSDLALCEKLLAVEDYRKV